MPLPFSDISRDTAVSNNKYKPMAQRRMFSQQIVDSDAFLDMPPTSQVLYFHLCMRADDDGFVSGPRKLMRMIGSSEDDFKVLLAKRFILQFESGVIVIKHWRIHNLLRGDRYKETLYKKEKATLGLNEGGAYTEIERSIASIEEIEKPDWQEKRRLAKEESELPYSFEYKIRQAFLGKNCPICGNEMRQLSVDSMEYGAKANPMPSIQHNVPISKGGKHELGNISVICHSCNVSCQDKETGELNAKEVIDVWNTIGNQSAPQVSIGKVSLGKSSQGKESAASLTPAQTMRNFLNDENQQNLIIQSLEEKGIPRDLAGSEIRKFISYWTERNKSGTKERWELQPTFDVGRRLNTWFSRIKATNQPTGKNYD